MNHRWNTRFLGLASVVASWSKDPSTQVGCVIVDRDKTIVSVGYNGFPRGVEDSPERYADRELKYTMVQHAEANALFSAASSPRGCTAYVTHHPCSNCAGMLIQSGIAKIVTKAPSDDLMSRFGESFRVTAMMCAEAGVELEVIG